MRNSTITGNSTVGNGKAAAAASTLQRRLRVRRRRQPAGGEQHDLGQHQQPTPRRRHLFIGDVGPAASRSATAPSPATPPRLRRRPPACGAFQASAALIQNSTITGNTRPRPARARPGRRRHPTDLDSTRPVTIAARSCRATRRPTAATTSRSLSAACPLNVNFSAIGDPDGFTPSATQRQQPAVRHGPGPAAAGQQRRADADGRLRGNSPLLNAGSNPASLTTDQLGAGFPRVATARRHRRVRGHRLHGDPPQRRRVARFAAAGRASRQLNGRPGSHRVSNPG